MRIFILTNELTEKNGWGRYSLDLSRALTDGGADLIIAAHKNTHSSEFTVYEGLPALRGYVRNYLTSFWNAWKFKKQASACDVIHAFTEQYSLIAYFLSKLTGGKYVVTVHGTYGLLPYNMSPVVRWIHHHTLKSATKIICVSSYTKKLLEEKGLTNAVVINNGINYNRFPKQSRPYSERQDMVLTVGALKHRKGQHISLEAFCAIASNFPSLAYVFVGDTSDAAYYTKLKEKVKALGVEKRVSFLSGISDQELSDLYESAKLFVMTSITKNAHFEGFGLVYLEANAHGVPVIGATGSGAEDAIQHGETGFLVLQKDAQKTADAMKKILLDEQLWAYMSSTAQQWAWDHDWSKIVGEYVRIYSL